MIGRKMLMIFYLLAVLSMNTRICYRYSLHALFSVNLNFNLIILASFILPYVLLCYATFNWWEVCFLKETAPFENIFVAGIHDH